MWRGKSETQLWVLLLWSDPRYVEEYGLMEKDMHKKKKKKHTHMAWGIGKKENAPEIVFYCVMAWLVYKRCISKYKQPESNMFAAVCHCTITVWQARGGHSWKQIGKQMVSPQCLMDPTQLRRRRQGWSLERLRPLTKPKYCLRSHRGGVSVRLICPEVSVSSVT